MDLCVGLLYEHHFAVLIKQKYERNKNDIRDVGSTADFADFSDFVVSL